MVVCRKKSSFLLGKAAKGGGQLVVEKEGWKLVRSGRNVLEVWDDDERRGLAFFRLREETQPKPEYYIEVHFGINKVNKQESKLFLSTFFNFLFGVFSSSGAWVELSTVFLTFLKFFWGVHP
jgi:hypothetical protein